MNTKPRHIERPRLTSWTAGAMAALCFWATGCMYNTQDSPGAIEVDLDSPAELHAPEPVDSLLGDHAQLQYTSGDTCNWGAVSTYIASLEAYVAAVNSTLISVRAFLDRNRYDHPQELTWAIANAESYVDMIQLHATRLEQIIEYLRTSHTAGLEPDFELMREALHHTHNIDRHLGGVTIWFPVTSRYPNLPAAIAYVMECLSTNGLIFTGPGVVIDGTCGRLHARVLAAYNAMADACELSPRARRDYPLTFCDNLPGLDGIPQIHAEYTSSTALNRAEVALQAAGWENYFPAPGLSRLCTHPEDEMAAACAEYVERHDLPQWTNPSCVSVCLWRWSPVAREYQATMCGDSETPRDETDDDSDPSPGPSSDPTPDSPPAEPDSSPAPSEAGFGYEE